MISAAQTGFFYIARKNPTKTPRSESTPAQRIASHHTAPHRVDARINRDRT
jgi:hypothetical protein